MSNVTKETVNRLLKDIRQINKNPLDKQGIYYMHDERDMMKGYALIIGPKDTPYYGGYYFFHLTFPSNYPHSPPVVIFNTNADNIRFNPNFYRNGKVCVSLLNTWRGDQWSSCQTISSVLLTLCSLLCNDPLLNEPGINSNHPELGKYNDIIEYANINNAICDILNNTINIPYLSHFETIIQNQFKNNYIDIKKIVDLKVKEIPERNYITTSLYTHTVLIDYKNLKKKLDKIGKSLMKSNRHVKDSLILAK